MIVAIEEWESDTHLRLFQSSFGLAVVSLFPRKTLQNRRLMSNTASSVVQLAMELIRIRSVSPMAPEPRGSVACESEMATRVVDWFSERSLHAEILLSPCGRPSVIGRLDGNQDRGLYVLDAHLDTVPALDWPEAFHPSISAGRLFGRGACDVKGPLAAMLTAIERLSHLPEQNRPSVVFVGTADEEFGQAGAEAVVEAWKLDPSRFTSGAELRGVIVAEPTELHPVVAHHGVLRCTAATQGRAAHSSKPELGENAIYSMAKVVAAWQAYAHELATNRKAHPLCGGPRGSIGVIRGGAAVNIVPERCEIEIDRRVSPFETLDQAWEETTSVLNSAGVSNLKVSEPWTRSAPLADTHNHSFAASLVEQVQRAGHSSSAIGVSFGTHAPRYQELGAPVVVLGPGSIDQAHTHGEWISIAQLELAVDVLYEFLRDRGLER